MTKVIVVLFLLGILYLGLSAPLESIEATGSLLGIGRLKLDIKFK